VVSPRDRPQSAAPRQPATNAGSRHFLGGWTIWPAWWQRGDLVVLYPPGTATPTRETACWSCGTGRCARHLREEIDEVPGNSVNRDGSVLLRRFVDRLPGNPSRAILMRAWIASTRRTALSSRRRFGFLPAPRAGGSQRRGKTSVREAFDVALKAHSGSVAGDPLYSAASIGRFTDLTTRC